MKFIEPVVREFSFDSVAKGRTEYLGNGIGRTSGVRTVMQVNCVEVRNQ
jgi:hypothetical protein